MMFFRTMKRFAALAAAFAITLQALWPLLSHARPNDLTLLAPLCSIDGVTHYLEIKAGKTTPLDERSASHGEHCKMCVLGDEKSPAVLTQDFSAFLLAGNATKESAGPAKALLQAPQFLPAQPRAPPAIA